MRVTDELKREGSPPSGEVRGWCLAGWTLIVAWDPTFGDLMGEFNVAFWGRETEREMFFQSLRGGVKEKRECLAFLVYYHIIFSFPFSLFWIWGSLLEVY